MTERVWHASSTTIFLDFTRRFGLAPTTDPKTVLATLDIKPRKVRRWERELSPKELSRCEAILDDELRTFGYSQASPAPKPPTLSDWACAVTRDIVHRVPQKLRTWATRVQR